MSKILELADAYAGYVYGCTSAKLARAALQAEVDEQREDYLAKCSELEAVHEHYRIITVKLQAELEAARKDAAHLRNILSFARGCIGHPDNIAMLDAAIGDTNETT